MGKSLSQIIAEKLPKKAQLWMFEKLQHGEIFQPNPKNLEPIKEISCYGFHNASAKMLDSGDHSIEIWQSERAENQSVFVVFHGNTGHFGHVGKTAEHEDPEYRIKLLQEIEKQGAAFIAVSLRGFGNSTGQPSQEAFTVDVKAVIEHLKSEKISPKNTVLMGESLGAATAMIMAEKMTEQNIPPAIVTKIAAFSSMAKKVSEALPKLNIRDIRQVIKHPFDTLNRFGKLSKETHFYMVHPENDLTTDKSHSQELAKEAKYYGLNVEYREVSGQHITWNPHEVVKGSLEALARTKTTAKKKPHDAAKTSKYREICKKKEPKRDKGDMGRQA